MSNPLIAILFEFATLNGGERSMLAVLDWLKGQSHPLEFLAIAPPKGRLADALNARHIPLGGFSVNDDQGRRRSDEQIEESLIQILTDRGPQSLHGNSLAMGRLCGRIAGRLAIPTSAHLRDIIKLSAAAVADLNRNQRLIAVSNATRDFHCAQGIDASRVEVIHNVVDVELFQPRPRTGRLIEELGLGRSSSPPQIIATVGQIGPRKGQDVLAAAMPSIVKRIPTAHVVLIGERNSRKQESIDFEQSIYRDFANAGLSDHLHVLGYRDDVGLLLNEIDLLVHPARQEPFGRVLLEASAAALPIVATSVGGTAEIIIDGETGRLVVPGDSRALSAAIIEMLEDPQFARHAGEQARVRVIQHFSLDQAARGLARTWINLLPHHHPSGVAIEPNQLP